MHNSHAIRKVKKYFKDLRSEASRYIMADTKQFNIAIFPFVFFLRRRMKGKSLQNKNARIKQLCNREVQDFAMALRAQKVSGAFKKWAPGDKEGNHAHQENSTKLVLHCLSPDCL